MRQRFLTGHVQAQRQTEFAFLCSFDWSDDHGYAAHDQWVPLSCIDPSDHQEIEDACDGDMIEISIAEWYLKEKLG